MPVITSRKRKRESSDGEDGDDDLQDDELGDASLVDDSEVLGKTRGTLLITLRNVSPYTLWYVQPCSRKLHSNRRFTGTFPDSPRIHHL
jgi:25S rRNA (uracil2634-N3)-methyltransferase